MEFKDTLKIYRKQNRLSQQEVADRAGITRSAYANYEQGLREPDLATVRKLCAALNISADELLDIKK